MEMQMKNKQQYNTISKLMVSCFLYGPPSLACSSTLITPIFQLSQETLTLDILFDQINP